MKKLNKRVNAANTVDSYAKICVCVCGCASSKTKSSVSNTAKNRAIKG